MINQTMRMLPEVQRVVFSVDILREIMYCENILYNKSGFLEVVLKDTYALQGIDTYLITYHIILEILKVCARFLLHPVISLDPSA